jgi:hypothetical protein
MPPACRFRREGKRQKDFTGGGFLPALPDDQVFYLAKGFSACPVMCCSRDGGGNVKAK